MPENGRRRLQSWKEIATHLGRGIRTVVRWERERGLPVYRVPGGKGRTVFAYTDELDQWTAGAAPTDNLASRETHSLFSRRWPVTTAIVGVLAIAGVAAVWALSGDRVLNQIVIRDHAITALDTSGRELWRYPIGPRRTAPAFNRTVQLVDLNDDRRTDAITGLDLKEPSGTGEGRLFALDHAGRPLWERRVEDQLTFGDSVFTGPWQPDDVLAFHAGSEPLIAWALHHHTWWPSLLAVFDRNGTRVGTFVNAGWIRTVQASRDGAHLITGGFSNARAGAAFAVLDSRRPSGTSPEESGSPFHCQDCPQGRPLRYFVVPWSDVSAASTADGRNVSVMVYPDGSLALRAAQQPSAEFIIALSRDFGVVGCSVADPFWRVHEQFEREGVIAHSRSACPHRNGPAVQEWTPDGGWRTPCPAS